MARLRIAAAPVSHKALATPEGVNLALAVPGLGERVGAFLIDSALQIAVLIGFTLLMLAAGLGGAASGIGKGATLLVVIWILGAFALRFFWFTLFEAGPRGATPGKRRLGLRVAARDGAALSPAMVVARNMLREIEFFLPLQAVLYRASEGLADAAQGWAAVIWTGVFLCFPLFNRERLRIGDLIAGTIVVRAPKPVLAPDLQAGDQPQGYSFTEQQLAAYGIYELQRLEQVLRDATPMLPGRMRREDDPVRIVASAIRTKIGWPRGEDDLELLQAYYAALRTRLERGLVFGRRKENKHDQG